MALFQWWLWDQCFARYFQGIRCSTEGFWLTFIQFFYQSKDFWIITFLFSSSLISDPTNPSAHHDSKFYQFWLIQSPQQNRKHIRQYQPQLKKLSKFHVIVIVIEILFYFVYREFYHFGQKFRNWIVKYFSDLSRFSYELISHNYEWKFLVQIFFKYISNN